MPRTLLDELVEKRQQISDALDAYVATDDFDPDGADFKDLQARAEKADGQISAVSRSMELRSSADQLALRMGTSTPVADTHSTRDIGEQLVTSERFQAWKRSGAVGRAKLIEIPMRRTLIDTGSVPATPSRVYAEQAAFGTPLLNAFNRIQVSSGSVDVVTYGVPPEAGIVAEGAQKPEAALVIDVTPVTLQTIAHWVETTRQVVEDEPRLRDFISNSLLRGLQAKLETEAAGKVTGGSYGTPLTGTNAVEALAKGVAQVTMQGFRPNAILMNAMDAASLDYTIWDNTGGLSGGGRIWGVPIIPSGDIAAGAAFVGDWQAAAHHYYRASADLYVTDSDVGIVATAAVSNFKRNVLTWLAEIRAVSAIVQPLAVAEVTIGTGLPLAAASKPAPRRAE